jgi:hypothetical protein
MTGAPGINCIDIVRPFNNALHERALVSAEGEAVRVQLMGGIGSAALKHPGTVILLDERRIVTAGSFLTDKSSRRDLNPNRPPPNGTLRDMDALVLSDDPKIVDEVEAIAEETIGDQLEISIFPLRPGSHLAEQVAEPFGIKALKTFVSDRYVREDGGMDKALFPFAVEIEPEVLENWELEIGDDVFPVANPASAILNYLTRSISGLRHKDHDKVQDMAGHIFPKSPELVEWMVDGPGRSHMELAGIFQTFRRANSWPMAKRTLDVGGALEIRAGSVRALREHDAFMLADAEPNVQDAALLLALLKSRGLGIGESNEDIVRIFQKVVEGRIGTITKNK